MSGRALKRSPLPRLLALGLALLGVILIARALYIPAKAALAQLLLERAWLKARSGEAAIKPWPWADIVPVAEIEVPRLHRHAIVLEGANGQALAFGPGHMPDTPPIGASGTAVVAAHRDTQFAFLGALSLGDVITAQTAGGARQSYRVVATKIVKADASGLDPAERGPTERGPTGARLALVTCYPFTGLLHSPWRYVVLADREPDA